MPQSVYVLTGSIELLAGSSVLSAISKKCVEKPVFCNELGLIDDQQQDLRVHGGLDKAILCFGMSSYDYWRNELPHHPLLENPGAFGENVVVNGLDESTVCLGDVWAVGSAIFVVSQGRQPCWKLNLRFGRNDMAHEVQRSCRSGWYMRVNKPGVISHGDEWSLLSRPFPLWSMGRILHLIDQRVTDSYALVEVLKLPLTVSWKKLFTQRLETQMIEDWRPRLTKTDS